MIENIALSFYCYAKYREREKTTFGLIFNSNAVFRSIHIIFVVDYGNNFKYLCATIAKNHEN